MSEFKVKESQQGKRLDAVLAEEQPQYSRANWQKLIAGGHVHVDGVIRKAKHVLNGGETVRFNDVSDHVNVDLPTLYEDDNVIVINKPHGLLVHPRSELKTEPTVVDMVSHKLEKDEGVRPGIVHRLDRDTSGVMVIAKNAKTKKYIMKQFENRTAKKQYVAVVAGRVPDTEADFEWPIARSRSKPATFIVDSSGKTAHTHMERLVTKDGASAVLLSPSTGRTHQLRVHMKKYGYPIIGDRVYGKVLAPQGRLMLHAWKLELAIAHNEHHKFEAPLPAGFKL